MPKKHSGFTLIELMVLVAIIVILTAIPIPQYQNYVARSQVSEALSLVSGAKIAITEYHDTNGKSQVVPGARISLWGSRTARAKRVNMY